MGARRAHPMAVDYAAMNDHRLWYADSPRRLPVKQPQRYYLPQYSRILKATPDATRRNRFGPLVLAALIRCPPNSRQFGYRLATNGVKTDWRTGKVPD